MLPKKLWFQFQDQQDWDIVSYRMFLEAGQNALVEGMWEELQHQRLWLDMFRLPGQAIVSGLTQHSPGLVDSMILNCALQHLTVTFPADEAICISLLTEFLLHQLLANENMDVKDKINCARIACAKSEREWTRNTAAFTMAPRSLVEVTAGINWLSNLMVPKIGRIVESGLLFQSVGFIVYHREWQDGLKRNPLEAISPSRANFTCATFEDPRTGNFYSSIPSGNVSFTQVPFPLQRSPGYNFPKATPLAIIPAKEFNEGQTCEAILRKVEWLGNVRHKVTEFVHVILSKYRQYEDLNLHTAEEIALSARSPPYVQHMNEFTVEDKDSEEFQTFSRNILSSFLEAAMGGRTDEKVLEALRSKPIGKTEDSLEIFSLDWFWNDYVAERFEEDKDCCVD